MARDPDAAAFDAVLMDLRMPVMDGYVVATAHALPEERERCLSTGIADYLTKPIDLARLVRVILRHAQEPEPGPVPAADALLDRATLLARFQGREAFVDKLLAMPTLSRRVCCEVLRRSPPGVRGR